MNGKKRETEKRVAFFFAPHPKTLLLLYRRVRFQLTGSSDSEHMSASPQRVTGAVNDEQSSCHRTIFSRFNENPGGRD